MVIGFAGSALFSGLETGAYSINRVRLQVFAHQGDRRAVRLRRMIENPTTLLATLLIGNNITNQLGTSALTALFEMRGFGVLAITVLTTAVVTPLLFVVGETLPKDLFSAHADRLMYRLEPVLSVARLVFRYTGLTPLVWLISAGFMRLLHEEDAGAAFHPRRQVQDLVKEGVGYGLLSDEQSALVERVLDLAELTVGDEMVAWEEVIRVPVDEPGAILWWLADETSRSRFPVVGEGGEVVGVVDVWEALRGEREGGATVAELMGPVFTMPAEWSVRRGLREMQRGRVKLAVVMGTRGDGDEGAVGAVGAVGVVTVKDLVEPMTGELVTW